MYSRETINELNQLSMKVFQSTSKWKKMIELGVPELVEEDTKRLSIKDGKEEYETVKTPKMHVGNGGGEVQQYVLKRYTVESVKEFMLMVLERRKQMEEALKKLEEQKAEQDQKQATVEAASGSSV